ncbi:hypothetical protein IJ843_04780 [bacterium]|nr:hypothetical protein [bacterium]
MDKLKWLKLKSKFYKVVGWGITVLTLICVTSCLIFSIQSKESFDVIAIMLVIIITIGSGLAWKFGFKKDLDVQSEIMHYEALNNMANK